MLLSWSPALGRGTSKTAEKSERERQQEMQLNYVGNVETTRFLAFAALKEKYCEDGEMLPQAMEHFANNLDHTLRTGIECNYHGAKFRLRLGVIGVKGDWPFLIEAGNLSRHFRRAPKRGESQLQAHGICHICMAGTQGFPYSDCSDAPRFEGSIGSAAASQFDSHPSPYTRLLPEFGGCEA